MDKQRYLTNAELDPYAQRIRDLYTDWAIEHATSPDVTINRVWFLHFVDAVLYNAHTGNVRQRPTDATRRY